MLTVDHHPVGGFGGADGVVEDALVLPVVFFLQQVDHQRAHVLGEHQAGAGSQLVSVFFPCSSLHVAPCCLAAEVGRAVAGDEGFSRASDSNT